MNYQEILSRRIQNVKPSGIRKFFDILEDTIRSTGLVIVCLVVVSAVISLLDLGLSNLILWLGSLV